MFFNIFVALFGVMFGVGLESLNYFRSDLDFFIGLQPRIFSFGVAFLLFVWWWLFRKIAGTSKLSLSFLVFSYASVLMLYLVDNPAQQHAFIAVSSGLCYFFLLGVWRMSGCAEDLTARSILSASLMATFFLFFSAMYGVYYLNFSIPLWLLAAIYCVVTTSISYQNLVMLGPEKRSLVFIYSLLLGLVMAQLMFLTGFWPFGYLTVGAVVLIAYYILWDLTQSYFLNILSQKRLLKNLAFLGAMAAFLLATTRWMPLT